MVKESTLEKEDVRGDYIWTNSGKKYYSLDPRVEDVDIHDISHALSLLCRYTGHVNTFYSVAEHCVILSHVVPPELALEALLHDAVEAYLNDINRPLKYAEGLRGYREIEEANSKVIYEKFGLNWPESPIIKEFDARIVGNEKKKLFNTIDFKENEVYPLIPNIRINGWDWRYALAKYRERFRKLYVTRD